MTTADLPARDDRYTIFQSEMDWLRIPFWESLFSQSNGLLGTRGSFEEPMVGTRSRSLTFMAGLYNTLPDGLPELPALPDALTTRIVLCEQPFDLRRGHIRSFARWLDMKRGLLCRAVTWRDPAGHTTRLTFERFVSLADRSILAVRVRITPVDWSGPLEVEMGIRHGGDPAGGKGSHWEPPKLKSSAHGLATLETRTSQTRRPLAVAGAYAAAEQQNLIPGDALSDHCTAGQSYIFDASQGAMYTFDRFIAYMTGPPDAESPAKQARQAALAASKSGWNEQLDDHLVACAELWDRMDIEIDGPVEDQRAVRFNLFQLATLCPQPGEIVSIGPKGLSGTHYGGHVFWDTEIYMLPFFALTHPEGAKALLTYRCATLDGARRKARSNNYRGAQYAWESADTGDEACPTGWTDLATGERHRIWCGDIQDHISADVPFAIDQYVRMTGDEDFLWEQGAEVVFETARFWASRVTRNADGRFEIRDAMGPDEFHIHVDNDAFTNYMARWNLQAAANLWDHASFPKNKRKDLAAQLGLDADDVAGWREIAENLVLLYDEQTGLINQHMGFFDRPEVSPDILRITRSTAITEIIGAGMAIEGQVIKQAEVVLLQTLLDDQFTRESREANFRYYEPRTSHDSSLSVSAHAWAAATLDRIEEAYSYFRRAAYLDLNDLAGNTADGLHAGNMGGVWLTVAMGFAGLNLKGDTPAAVPALPSNWKHLRMNITFRGRKYVVDCGADGATVEER
jgi:trehalose/maltose hydrolase-like predicted phosphorylase